MVSPIRKTMKTRCYTFRMTLLDGSPGQPLRHTAHLLTHCSSAISYGAALAVPSIGLAELPAHGFTETLAGFMRLISIRSENALGTAWVPAMLFLVPSRMHMQVVA